MKRASWLVTDSDGIAPNGLPDKCFWCGATKGLEHNPECVCRRRTVVVKVELEIVVVVPESWTPNDIEFHRNESSWCSNNFIDELNDFHDRGADLCANGGFEFVREATEGDEKRDRLFIESYKRNKEGSQESPESLFPPYSP